MCELLQIKIVHRRFLFIAATGAFEYYASEICISCTRINTSIKANTITMKK